MFKVGDKVKCVNNTDAYDLEVGAVYTVICEDNGLGNVELAETGEGNGFWPERFVLSAIFVGDAPTGNNDPAPGLPTDSATRKNLPVTSGVLDYFPLAVAYVAYVSKVGNDQHNPGQPMHWAREKSTDHPDCIARHLMERGTKDTDGLRHSGKLAWRALANLQREIEDALAAGEKVFDRG